MSGRRFNGWRTTVCHAAWPEVDPGYRVGLSVVADSASIVGKCGQDAMHFFSTGEALGDFLANGVLESRQAA